MISPPKTRGRCVRCGHAQDREAHDLMGGLTLDLDGNQICSEEQLCKLYQQISCTEIVLSNTAYNKILDLIENPPKPSASFCALKRKKDGT